MATRHYCDGCGEEIKYDSYPRYLIEVNVIPQNNYAPIPDDGVYTTYDVYVTPPDVGGIYHSRCVTIVTDDEYDDDEYDDVELVEDEEYKEAVEFLETGDVPPSPAHEAWERMMASPTQDQKRIIASEFIAGATETMTIAGFADDILPNSGEQE